MEIITEVKQWVNDRWYKEITIGKSTIKTMSFKTQDRAIEYASGFLDEISELTTKDKTSEANLTIPVVSISDCKGDYLLKDNKCEKYDGFCVKCNCDYWQPDC